MFGERRRVKDDEVILLVGHLVEELKGIRGVGGMTVVAGEIQLNVGIGERGGLGRRIDRVDLHCASAHCIDGEAARVAEHVQHLPPLGEFLEQGAVLTLVNEETGLLTAEPVDVELQAVLEGDVSVIRPDKILVLGVEVGLVREGRLRLVVDIADTRLGQRCQGLRNLAAHEVHARRMGLDHGRVAIDVDDQTRKEIALAVNEAERVVVLADEAEGLSDSESLLKAFGEETLGELVDTELEDTDNDAANLIMAHTQYVPLRGDDLNQVTLLDTFGNRSHGAREHPGVASEK